MNKIGTRQDECIHFMFSGSRRKRLGTSISWKVVQKDHNHHKLSGHVEAADLLQPSLRNYEASFLLHSYLSSWAGFKGKKERPCLFQPPSSDHSYQSAFIQLVGESIPLNLALPLKQEIFEDSLSTGTRCSGGTAKVGICKALSSGFLWQIMVEAVSLNMSICPVTWQTSLAGLGAILPL